MTTKTRFQLSVTGLIISVLIFLVFTFIPQLKALNQADFWQGFSGGIAMGSFLGVLHYGREMKAERA
jgi:hypothetical protein